MSGTLEPGLASTKTSSNPRQIARDVIHRCNNFLSLLVVQGESALESKDIEVVRAAIRNFLRESSKVEEFLRSSRLHLGE